MKSTSLIESREVKVTTPDQMRDELHTSFAIEYFQTTLQDISIYEDGTLEFPGNCFPHTDRVHDQIVQRADIPLGFEQKIPFDQYKELFEKRKHDMASALTVCVSNGVAVGIGPAHYGYQSSSGGVAKTVDLLDLMSWDDDVWQFESATISDIGVKLNLLVPGAEAEPEEGDIVNLGLEISNSETGGQSLKSELFAFRLVCENGMISKTDRTSVLYTKFGRMSYPSKLRLFTKQLESAKEHVLEEAKILYEGIADASILDADLLQLHRTLKRRLGPSRLDADEVLGIARKVRLEIANTVRERGKFAMPQPTEFSTWQIHNSITAVGREQKLALRQSLEQLGGAVLLIESRRRNERLIQNSLTG